MDDKTLQALTILANKLGTTAEYLWGVLLKQAPISGVTDLLTCVLLIFAAIALTKFVYCKTKPRKSECSSYEYPEWNNEAAFFAWAGCFLFFCFALLSVAFSIQGIVAAFLNPEYWTLMQILKK